MKNFTSILYSLFLLTFNLSAQVPAAEKFNLPSGISVEYGTGAYAHTDDYISEEKYSDTLPFFKTGFISLHDGYIYHLEMEYRSSSEIKNHTVSADVILFNLNQGFLYPLTEFDLFSHTAHVFFGLAADILLFFNEQNIAVTGFDYAQSYASLF